MSAPFDIGPNAKPGVTYRRRKRRPLSFQCNVPLPLPVDVDRAEAA